MIWLFLYDLPSITVLVINRDCSPCYAKEIFLYQTIVLLRSVHGGCRTTKMAQKLFMVNSIKQQLMVQLFLIQSAWYFVGLAYRIIASTSSNLILYYICTSRDICNTIFGDRFHAIKVFMVKSHDFCRTTNLWESIKHTVVFLVRSISGDFTMNTFCRTTNGNICRTKIVMNTRRNAILWQIFLCKMHLIIRYFVDHSRLVRF